MIGKFFRIGLMIASAMLAVRAFWMAYFLAFRPESVLRQIVSDPKAVLPEAITAAMLEAPIDFLTGLALLFWPFTLAG